MKHLNVQFDAETSEFLRRYAAKRGITVKEYLDELVRECMKEALEYERARQAFMEIMKRPFNVSFPEGRLPKREELHDRPKHFFR